jgi:hypothetical protein
MTRSICRCLGAGTWLLPVLAVLTLGFAPARAHGMPVPWGVILIELARQEIFPTADETVTYAPAPTCTCTPSSPVCHGDPIPCSPPTEQPRPVGVLVGAAAGGAVGSATDKAAAEVQRLRDLLKAERERSALLEKRLQNAHKKIARLEKEAGKVCQAACSEKAPAKDADSKAAFAELQRQWAEMGQKIDALRVEMEALRQQVQPRPAVQPSWAPYPSPTPTPYGESPRPVPNYSVQPLPPGGNGPYYQAPVVPLNEAPSGSPGSPAR